MEAQLAELIKLKKENPELVSMTLEVNNEPEKESVKESDDKDSDIPSLKDYSNDSTVYFNPDKGILLTNFEGSGEHEIELWESQRCYSVLNFQKSAGTDFPSGIYFQTYGGGPEGGYVIDEFGKLYKVHRDWFKPFTMEKLPDHKLVLFKCDADSTLTLTDSTLIIIRQQYEKKCMDLLNIINDDLDFFYLQNDITKDYLDYTGFQMFSKYFETEENEEEEEEEEAQDEGL